MTLTIYFVLLGRNKAYEATYVTLVHILESYKIQRENPSFTLYEKLTRVAAIDNKKLGYYKSCIDEILRENQLKVVSSEDTGETINYTVIADVKSFLQVCNTLEEKQAGISIQIHKLYREKSQTYIKFSVAPKN